MLSLPLCGCYGLWDTNQTLIQFVTGAKLEVAKKPTYAEERDGARRRKVIVKTKAEVEAEKGKKGGADAKPGDDSDVAILKKAQERVDNKDKAPAEPKPAEPKPAETKPTLPAPPADAKPEDTQVVAKPQYPEQKAPPAVPRPAVKVDASADAAGTKPMIPLPSPAKSIPQNATPAEKSWQAKTAKRDRKAPQQQERKADAPAESRPAEPAQAGDAPKPS